MVPIGNVCKRDLVTKVDVYPMMTVEEAAAKFHSDDAFAKEFENASLIREGVLAPEFRLNRVLSTLMMGMSIDRELIVLDEAEFLLHFGYPAASVEGLVVIPGLLNEEGTPTRAIVMANPEKPFRTLRIFSHSQNSLDEFVMPKAKHLRPTQGADKYAWLRGMVTDSRHEGIRCSGHLFSIDQVREKVAEAKAKKEATRAADEARLRHWEQKRNSAPTGKEGADDDGSEVDDNKDDEASGEDEIVSAIGAAEGEEAPATALLAGGGGGNTKAKLKGKGKAKGKAKGKGKAKAVSKRSGEARSNASVASRRLRNGEESGEDVQDVTFDSSAADDVCSATGGSTTGGLPGSASKRAPSDPVEAVPYWIGKIDVQEILRGRLLGRELFQAAISLHFSKS